MSEHGRDATQQGQGAKAGTLPIPLSTPSRTTLSNHLRRLVKHGLRVLVPVVAHGRRAAMPHISRSQESMVSDGHSIMASIGKGIVT